MIGLARSLRDRLLGRGEHAVTVPPMDGALRPNNDLETARVIAALHAPDDLVATEDAIIASSEGRLLRFGHDGGAPEEWHRFDSPIVALASNGAGSIAVALENGALFVANAAHEHELRQISGKGVPNVTAIAFDGADSIVVCRGSSAHTASNWQYDLMERGASGALLRVGLGNGRLETIASGLAFPAGVLCRDGGFTVSESWQHRIVHIDAGGNRRTLLDDLPGYPSRLSWSGDGCWLCVFAPRSQLVEFVLREEKFRKRMIREISPDYWVAPVLSPGRHHLNPMQGGAMIVHGIHKPWAPSRSYGLVVRLNADMQPVASHHSRANGRIHGVTSCVESGGSLWIASRGGNAIVSMDIGTSTDRRCGNAGTSG